MGSWRIVYMGTPDFAVYPLQALLDGGEQVVGVFTQPDKKTGRGQKTQATPVKVAASQANIPVFQPLKMRDPEAVAQLKALQPDLVVVTAYGQILSEEVLAIPPQGCINIHASLLPRWRGAAPIQRALLAGDEESGISIMLMEKGLDTGPVYSSVRTPLSKTMTGGELHDQLARLGADLLLKTLSQMKAGTVPAQAQPEQGVTYAKKLTRADEEIDWSQPAEQIQRQIFALNPWPAAMSQLGNNAIKLFRCSPGQGQITQPGTVIALHEEGPEISCGQGSLIITEIQKPGKKRMPAADWLRGRPLKIGDRLGSW
ncbi:MAG: methionyl-tRNA formyltransferase [Magnetococcales bacterium]|nr:methionyl-tRNA formyltransferase [Magnetococcales bacterium]